MVLLKVRELTAEKTLHRLAAGDGVKGILIHLASFAFAFLAANGSIFGRYAPFGISFVAAVPFPNVITSFIGAFLGYIAFPVQGGSFRYIAAMTAVIAIRWTLGDIKRLNRHSLYSAVVCFAPTFATGLAMMSVRGFSAESFSIYTAEALLGGAGAYFISRTIIMLGGTRSLGMLMPQELACLILTGCIGILALSGLTVATLSIGRILSAALILFAARYGGISGGTVAGISTGIVLGMSSPDYVFLGAAYAFGGLMAGLFSPVGKIAAGTAFLLSCAVIALQSGSSGAVIRIIYECAASALIFLCLPQNAGSFFRAVFVKGMDDQHAEGLRRSVIMRLDFASKALSDVSANVEEVSEKLEALVTPTIEEVYQDAVDKTCAKCGMKVFCWEHKDGVSMASFDYVTDKLCSEGSITGDDFRGDFIKKCCRRSIMAEAINNGYQNYLASRAAEKRIEEVRQVVAGQFCGLGDILGDMAEEYSNYDFFDSELSEEIAVKLKEYGLTPLAVSCRTDHLGRMTIEAETAGTDQKKLKRALIVKDLSRLCGRHFDSPCITSAYGSCRLTLCERPCLDVELGSSQHICGSGRLCGDSLKYFTDGTGRLTALISDGMGTGGRAAVDGNMASGLMERLIKAGLGYDCALKVVNSALLVKSGDESLATIDVVSVDMYNGRTDLMKAGAALSFIRKSGDMYRVETPSLPAGILPQVEFTYTQDDLSAGDIIVMVSDGAIASGEDWIERIISTWEDKSMEQLSELIVDEAIARRTDSHDDDITVIAMQLKTNQP